jgi:hypothetical protein
MMANDFYGKLLTVNRMLASAATLIATLAVTAGPAIAEPNPFGSLGCSCDTPAGKPDIKDQVNQGIQTGLDSLHHPPGT